MVRITLYEVRPGNRDTVTLVDVKSFTSDFTAAAGTYTEKFAITPGKKYIARIEVLTASGTLIVDDCSGTLTAT